MEYTENYVKSIDEALQDKAFLEKLDKAENKEQFAELFRKEKGIELTAEDAGAAFDKLVSMKKGEELTAEDLESVAGGSLMQYIFLTNGAITGANWGAKMWGPGFGAMLGWVAGRQIADNIYHGRFC